MVVLAPLLLLLLAPQCPCAQQLEQQQVQLLPDCSSEEQQVQCGQLPVDSPDAVAVYAQCCQLFEPKPLPPAAQAATARATAAQAATAASTPRPDLDITAGRYATPPLYFWDSQAVVGGQPASGCVVRGTAVVPAFSQSQQVSNRVVTAPLLTSAQIRRVKARALGSGTSRALRRPALRMRAQVRHTAPAGTTFLHPAQLMSAAEITLMQFRLNRSISPQARARDNMLTGESVPPKFYRYNASVVWNPPVNTPISWAPGPYPMARVSTKYGGWEEDTRWCPSQYPSFAPLGICGHVSFVELDGQMVYKQALAYHATKDTRYAQNAFTIMNAWATANRFFEGQNGPLEAGWGVAAMARSLELLRMDTAFGSVRTTFVSWFNTYLKPQMVRYIDVTTAVAVSAGNLNVYGNWHATIAEAFMAVAVVTDDTALFAKAVELFKATTTNYLRWGRDPAYSTGRIVGECTETLRDIYHTEFGLGALLQTAEMAWQQDMDLYSTAGFALVSAMELHARIINAWDAGKQESLLPQGFRFYDKSMPAPPNGTQWVFDMQQQLWNARKPDGTVVSTLRDGFKYLLGVKWLPTGWEIGYNHYMGRLGIPMPETVALIKRYPVEHHEFHWGQGTLTHADTAYQLWRPGLSLASLC